MINFGTDNHVACADCRVHFGLRRDHDGRILRRKSCFFQKKYHAASSKAYIYPPPVRWIKRRVFRIPTTPIVSFNSNDVLTSLSRSFAQCSVSPVKLFNEPRISRTKGKLSWFGWRWGFLRRRRRIWGPRPGGRVLFCRWLSSKIPRLGQTYRRDIRLPLWSWCIAENSENEI